MQAPKIDKRTYEEIVKQTEELAEKYTKEKGVAWQPAKKPDQIDAGGALIRIFARFAEHVIDRLNQVPEKNFLTFLNLIGTRITPPQPARVPLTFYLPANSPVNAKVPVGTQVAAPPRDAHAKEVIFETEHDLVVTRSQLKAVYVHNPDKNMYSNRTRQALGGKDEAFSIFIGDHPIECYLYLACDRLLTRPGEKKVIFSINENSADKLKDLTLTWAYWNGKKWTDVTPSSERWPVTIEKLPPLRRRAVNKVEAGWLRVTIGNWHKNQDALAALTRANITVSVDNKGISPESGFSNALPLDLSKDFYPFGEAPRFNDTFYLAYDGQLAQPEVAINLELNPDHSVVASDDLELAWEVWEGTTWQGLECSSPPNSKETTEAVTTNFEDKTLAFTQTGQVEFTLPATIGQTMVNGKLAYWLRVRMVRGNYGVGVKYKPKFVPATFAPPVVKTIRFRYEQARLSACQLYHEFTYHDCKAKVASGEGSQQDKSADEKPPKSTSEQNDDAEAKCSEQSALYLGFEPPFENRRITLYAQIKSPKLDQKADNDAKKASVAQIRWQYASPDGKWTSLSVEDETQNFTRSGLIHFIGPKDFEKRKLFGKHLYWLRACLHTDKDKEEKESPRQAEPQLRRLLLNTTWASQRQTIRNEILGSSNGKENQSFCTAQTPVLEGQQIEVRDSQLNQIGQREESWVPWHPQPDFYSSGPDDRHYVFDHLTGNVRFGNGRQGKIPPRGRKNIRAALYRTGGGVAGNQPTGAIVELKSSVPYIDSVTNLEPASGGVEQEALAKVKERGPKSLRHRNRAVTPEDFEDLARQASPKVARAKVIYPLLKKDNKTSYNMTNTKTTQQMVNGKSIDKGQISLILVPDSDEQQPTPSLNLIRRVREYLRSRCAATLDVDKDLQITGPTWVKVTVTVSATIRPNSSDNTDLEATVKEALTRFLHPLTGGTNGKGWPFGRQPHKSDLYALIQRVPGVDHVLTLQVEPKPESLPKEPFLVYSGEHKISIG